MSAVDESALLDESLQWVNCGPQSFAPHRGKVVALVFWHAGSVYSENLLQDMQVLQRKHADGMAVIGVHTPKFEAERNARLVLKAINRLQLTFPVALDADFALWQQFAVESWPTVMLLDCAGHHAMTFVGDLQREAIDRGINELLDRASLDSRKFSPQPACLKPETQLPLAYPSGVAVSNNHLYIADTVHNRILECSHDGRILRQFGSTTQGLIDGNSAECSFRNPRGLLLTRDTLYVADTGNHALRRIRLMDGTVDTLAGTGRPGVLAFGKSVTAENAPLNAPWAIAGNFERLYIAMAGAQQVWEFDHGDRTLRVLAGNGRIGLADGGGEQSAFAQPCGLVLVEQNLYVVDAASSAVRNVHVPSRSVHTLVGQGLFEFGDQDGVRSQALMQFPTALAQDARSSTLWIADTYNNHLRVLRLTSGDLRRHELNYRLHEPTGLATSPGALWIANTNAHEVLRVDLSNDTVRRLPIGE
jgi:hypothetical protein